MIWKSRAVAILTLVVMTGAVGVSAARADEFAYVGTKQCKRCHLKQWKSWAETSMAQAFETLKPGVAAEAKEAAGLDPATDYTVVDGCVVCHVTGYGREGGFIDIESTPDLAGVGCESCHGPGGTYTQDEYMSLGNKEFLKSELLAVGFVSPVGEAQCVTCHNAASPFVSESDVFHFEELKNADTHQHFELKYEH